MARSAAKSQLTKAPRATVVFNVATREDDAAIRRLLRENPMAGSASLSFEREPDYFAGTEIGSSQDDTILAFENGQLVCMGRCSVRDRFVNGRICSVGYLGELRLDKNVQGRFDILRRGYTFFRELHDQSPPELYFTSIGADNKRSLRFLERGLAGMPVYHFIAELTTVLIAVPRSSRIQRSIEDADDKLASAGLKVINATAAHTEKIADFLNAHSSRHQLATVWTPENLFSLTDHGLPLDCWRLLVCGGETVGCLAFWDQRSFRQIVIRGYNPSLSFARPFINFGARIVNAPTLPRVNSVLSHAFLSPLAIDIKYESLLGAFIERTLVDAGGNEVQFVSVGFQSDDPRLNIIRSRFRCREYQSRLYQVLWPGVSATKFDTERAFLPEISLL